MPKRIELSPFEEKWGVRRVGWGSGMTLRCTHCGGTMGTINRGDWMHRANLYGEPAYEVRILIEAHLASPETPRQCLEYHFAMSKRFYRSIASNPSSDVVWLQTIAQNGGWNWTLSENPVLPLLLLEDPAHEEWIRPLLKVWY